jgi:hypothetical protein
MSASGFAQDDDVYFEGQFIFGVKVLASVMVLD